MASWDLFAVFVMVDIPTKIHDANSIYHFNCHASCQEAKTESHWDDPDKKAKMGGHDTVDADTSSKLSQAPSV